MREDEELIEQARRSREETDELREESGLGSKGVDTEPKEEDDGPLPEKRDPEPWAKTSSGDKEHVTDDR